MKIQRMINGKKVDIKLTNDEMQKIAHEYKMCCAQEDIKSKVEDIIVANFNGSLTPVFVKGTQHEMNKMAKTTAYTLLRGLDMNDSYWDIYWDAVEQSIDNATRLRKEMVKCNLDRVNNVIYVYTKDDDLVAEIDMKTREFLVHDFEVLCDEDVCASIRDFIESNSFDVNHAK